MRNYMAPYWESRLAECERGREYAEKQLSRIVLLEMDQLTIPLQNYERTGTVFPAGSAVEDTTDNSTNIAA